MQEVAEADDVALAQDILAKRGTGAASVTQLEVDDRVFARITDGIYRQPSSALRELISNAYDADATEVIIQTDSPRFDRIVIRDNGNGMSPEVLSYVLKHIGGSSKRTHAGIEKETVNPNDPDLSFAGRRLIGKIGIGIFSVAQLTQHFQIITKRKGDKYRTSADVALQTYTEDGLADQSEKKFVAGEVTITSEETSNVDAHGTEIILMDLRPSAQDALRSLDRWEAAVGGDEGKNAKIDKPQFHIGLTREGEPSLKLTCPVLPWSPMDRPEEKFSKLYQAVCAQSGKRERTPNIQTALDNYLTMLWTLSLSAPVRYMWKHPFELTAEDGVRFFLLSEKVRGTAEEVVPPEGVCIGAHLGLEANVLDPLGGFRVIVDEIELFRPIILDGKLVDEHSIDKPLMFIGKCRSKLGDYDPSFGGGSLEFESYFFWNSKIVPKENNGILVRINNASGIPFDRNFMDYQVAELTRLRQITSEVFIKRGLDAALNIDRESFNYSHPHYQFLMRWVHAAVKQVTNKLKNLSQDAADAKRAEALKKAKTRIQLHALATWYKRRGENAEPPRRIQLMPRASEQQSDHHRSMGEHVLISPWVERVEADDHMRASIEALVTILDAWGILEDMTYEEQEELLHDISKVQFNV